MGYIKFVTADCQCSLILKNLYRAGRTRNNTPKCCTVCKHLQCNTCKCLSTTMPMTCLVPTALDSHCPNIIQYKPKPARSIGAFHNGVQKCTKVYLGIPNIPECTIMVYHSKLVCTRVNKKVPEYFILV